MAKELTPEDLAIKETVTEIAKQFNCKWFLFSCGRKIKDVVRFIYFCEGVSEPKPNPVQLYEEFKHTIEFASCMGCGNIDRRIFWRVMRKHKLRSFFFIGYAEKLYSDTRGHVGEVTYPLAKMKEEIDEERMAYVDQEAYEGRWKCEFEDEANLEYLKEFDEKSASMH